ncbi:MAG: hypothetical protein J7498_05415 [Sphingobium sp.]|nr:hypothetical protein [Sphingobium sp.]
MRDVDDIMRERQLAVRREIDRRGIAIKAIAFDAGISRETLLSYFPGGENRKPAVIPTSVVFAIIEGNALPLELVSMLLPDGAMVVRVPEEIDHDVLCEAMQAYLEEKARAHRLDSPMGPAIAPCEHDKLTRLAVVAGTAVAA